MKEYFIECCEKLGLPIDDTELQFKAFVGAKKVTKKLINSFFKQIEKKEEIEKEFNEETRFFLGYDAHGKALYK